MRGNVLSGEGGFSRLMLLRNQVFEIDRHMALK
jgi:hypothetical protein